MLIRSMFRKAIVQHISIFPGSGLWWGASEDLRRRTGCLEEGGFADVALDILGLLVYFELRLGDSLVVFVFARAL
jgi:hypothetical protein